MLFLIFHYVKNILPIQKTQYISELKGKFLYYCPPSLNLHEFTRPSPATASFTGKHPQSPPRTPKTKNTPASGLHPKAGVQIIRRGRLT